PRLASHHQLRVAERERRGEHLRGLFPARAGKVLDDAQRRFDAAGTMRAPQLLCAFPLLFEIEVGTRFGRVGHETTFLDRCPHDRLEDSQWRMRSDGDSRQAQPFPRTGCTLDSATASIACGKSVYEVERYRLTVDQNRVALEVAV